MELREYLFKKRITGSLFAENIECTQHTIVNIKNKKNSCGLVTALKIRHLSKGEVSFEDLLTQKDLDDYKNWLCKQKDISVEFEK